MDIPYSHIHKKKRVLARYVATGPSRNWTQFLSRGSYRGTMTAAQTLSASPPLLAVGLPLGSGKEYCAGNNKSEIIEGLVDIRHGARNPQSSLNHQSIFTCNADV